MSLAARQVGNTQIEYRDFIIACFKNKRSAAEVETAHGLFRFLSRLKNLFYEHLAFAYAVGWMNVC